MNEKMLDDMELEGTSSKKRTSMFVISFKRLCRNKLSVAGLIVIALMILIAIFAPLIAPYDYIAIDMTNAYATPSAAHIFGTDELGRDIFSRIIMGTRMSLLIGVVGVSASVLGGVIIGAIAGYFGKRIDNIIMRLLDILQSIPSMLLAIVISSALGPGIVNCILALSISNIPGVARLTRATILNIRDMEYIEAATATNCGTLRIITHHVLPNAISPLIVNSTMSLASTLLTAAALSFYGLGIQPPSAEWGAMLAGAREYCRSYPHMILFPGLAIMTLVLSINVVGDGLRDVLDPKLKD